MRVILGLGANTGNAAVTLGATARALGARFNLLGVSSLWRTAPVGPPQPDYLNAALLLDADVDPLRLLAVALGLEARAGRDRRRETRWGPRPLDIDLLAALSLVVEGPALTIPHPRLAERRFALLPSCELAPSWIHPRLHRPLSELLSALEPTAQPCECLGPLA